jgi:hypothetical protein
MAKTSSSEIRIEILDVDPLVAVRDARHVHEELKRVGIESRLERRAATSDRISSKGVPATEIIALVFSGMNLSIAAAQFWRMRRPGRRLSITRGDDVLEINGERIEDTKELIERFLETNAPPPPSIQPAAGRQPSETP